MTIRASAAKEIEALIADLTGPHTVAREAAIARLTVIGPRAVERLLAVLRSSPDASARASALRTLEGIRDPRSLGLALEAASRDDAAVAVAAIAVARNFLRADRGASVVEHLTRIALDGARPDEVRVAAIAALKDLGAATVTPLLKAVAGDAKPAVRAEAGRPAAAARATPDDRTAVPTAAEADALLARAAEEGVPDNPDRLRTALAFASRTTPLATLLAIVERVREREAGEPAKRREGWTTARAAGHLALARRRSRIGLYDLREWLETSRTPLPVDAFAALSLVGDASCLEPVAHRYASPTDEWSKSRLADLFRAIVTREGVSRRHPAVKRIERKHQQALGELWPGKAASRKRVRPAR